MEALLGSLMPIETRQLDPPTALDWENLEAFFGCQFNDDFKNFIALMAKYQFPGEIYDVSAGRDGGNGSIIVAYELEMQESVWNLDMIPFYGIGNGDYFCLHRGECPNSAVYYYYHDCLKFECYSDSFEQWVLGLPEFLA